MKQAVLYFHGKGGSAAEAAQYRPLFPDCDVLGVDYRSTTPWEAIIEFSQIYDTLCHSYDSVRIVANSIGAFFAMHALSDKPIEKAYFISPIVDMEALICDMLRWSNATEDELRARGEIETAFGETLSFAYLSWVRNHPISWQIPTRIAYGSEDNLQRFSAIQTFAARTGAKVRMLQGGEHWFHTPEQLSFLQNWILSSRTQEEFSMETKEPSFLDLLLEAHIGLERQGPGSPAMLQKALSYLQPLSQFSEIADLGCGTGGQTLHLAQHLPGHITALDLFPQFIETLNANAEKHYLENRITGVVGDMAQLPFDRHSLDLIWSEGAIDNIGFAAGVRHWREFLKPGGYLAVTCPCWLTGEHPEPVASFWAEAGSPLEPVSKQIEALQSCGYAFVAAFVLPEDCWTEQYFLPRQAAIEALQQKYPGSETMAQYAAVNAQEVALFSEYHAHYGYVFYIAKAI